MTEAFQKQIEQEALHYLITTFIHVRFRISPNSNSAKSKS